MTNLDGVLVECEEVLVLCSTASTNNVIFQLHCTSIHCTSRLLSEYINRLFSNAPDKVIELHRIVSRICVELEQDLMT